MGDIEAWKLVLGFIGTLVGAYLIYLGARSTAGASKEGVNRTAKVDEQQSALEAWKGLLEPMRAELDAVRTELREERDDRAEQQQRIERRRIEAKAEVDEQMAAMRDEIRSLSAQLGEWKRLAQTIARWATRLRDEVLRLGGTVPATPDELLTLRAIEDAEQDPSPRLPEEPR